MFLSFLPDDCRVLKFHPAVEGYSLKGHLLNSFKVQREGACKARCFVEYNCMSYNVGPLDEDGTNICELSDSDHQMHPAALVRQSGFTYIPTEVCLLLQGIASTFFIVSPPVKAKSCREVQMCVRF